MLGLLGESGGLSEGVSSGGSWGHGVDSELGFRG